MIAIQIDGQLPLEPERSARVVRTAITGGGEAEWEEGAERVSIANEYRYESEIDERVVDPGR